MDEEFVKEPLITTVRRAAEAELSKKATASDVRLLHDHPLMWLRALSRICKEVDNHIAKDRLTLAGHKPASGTHASDAYLMLKAEVDKRSLGRLHFKAILDRRIEDVKSIIGPDPLNRLTVGDMIDTLLAIIEDAYEGDFDAVNDRARFWVERLSEMEYGEDD